MKVPLLRSNMFWFPQKKHPALFSVDFEGKERSACEFAAMRAQWTMKIVATKPVNKSLLRNEVRRNDQKLPLIP